MDKFNIETNAPFKGFDFYATDFDIHPDLESEIAENGIIATMIAYNPSCASWPKNKIMEAFSKGFFKHTQIKNPTKLVAQNKLVNGYFADLFSHYDGTYGVNQTLEFKFLGIGTRAGVAVADGQTQLENEIYRFGPTERYSDNYRKFYFSRYITNAEGNMTSTTVDAGTWTTTNIDLVSDTGIALYDSLQISTSVDSLDTLVTITAKTGNNITYSPATAVAPVAGDTVTRTYGEIGLFLNPATVTLNTPKMADRAVTNMIKSGGKLINAITTHLAV